MKIEQSEAGLFTDDREAMLAQMQSISDRGIPPAKPLQIAVRDGVEIMALNQPVIDICGPISYCTLLVAPANLIVTAYILNQAAEVRAFDTMAQYELLRDKFVDELVACLKQAVP